MIWHNLLSSNRHASRHAAYALPLAQHRPKMNANVRAKTTSALLLVFSVMFRPVASAAFRAVGRGAARRVPAAFAARRDIFRTPPRAFRVFGGADRPASSLHLSSSAAAGNAAPSDVRIPVTLMSGFLGSGKTTALKHLLENKAGVRVGVIVNDVAEVNIDSKLINSSPGSSSAGVGSGISAAVELQNGCACCSLADELMDGVAGLLAGRDLDHVVIELSGVANPLSVVSNWEEAEAAGHPACDRTALRQVVTVVDSSTFGTDWMTWDSAGDRAGWTEEGDECSAARRIPELLAEQIEGGNTILMNKADIADGARVAEASLLVKSINEKATVHTVEFGKIDVAEIFGPVAAAAPKEVEKTVESKCGDSTCKEPACNEPSHAEKTVESKCGDSTCKEPACNEPSHAEKPVESKCADSTCKEPACDDPTCADPACGEPTCTDPTHDHSPSPAPVKKPADDLGIKSFVYRAERPFEAQRLLSVLNRWPVPSKDDLNLSELADAASNGFVTDDGSEEKSPFIGVIRSKGFAWMAPARWSGRGEDSWRHDTAMYWSHAGRHFGITTAGKWWGTITKEKVKEIFSFNEPEYNRIMAEDWVTEEFGDRRQEVVFIGVGLNEEGIRATLDNSLLNDEEMEAYRENVRKIVDTSMSSGI